MTKSTPTNIIRYLDNLNKYTSLSRAAPATGVAVYTIARWRRMSEEGAEDFQNIEYNGVTQAFHLHVQEIMEFSTEEIEADVRATARDGRYVVAMNKGEICYQDDESAVAADEASFKVGVELGLYWPDRKKRVRNEATGIWERQPIMVWQPPSVEIQSLVLRSWGERYRDKRSVDVNMGGNINLGVTVAKGIGVPVRPAVSAPPPQLQIINEAVSEAVFNEVVDEAAADDEPVPEGTFTSEQEAIIERSRSQNPMARALAQEYLSRQKKSLEPDNDPRRMGAGSIPPGGYKAV
jgi:hypothetical protein